MVEGSVPFAAVFCSGIWIFTLMSPTDGEFFGGPQERQPGPPGFRGAPQAASLYGVALGYEDASTTMSSSRTGFEGIMRVPCWPLAVFRRHAKNQPCPGLE